MMNHLILFKNVYKTMFKAQDMVTLAQRCEFEQGPMRQKDEIWNVESK
jgi:hypothetical protein